MSNLQSEQLLQMETTCGSLLYELQIIWNEVGETDTDRDKMLLELEQECLEVYRRKVDQANRSRAQLRQAIADSEAELAAICSAMGERPVHIRQSDQNAGSLKEELSKIIPQLEEMQKRKIERKNQFLEVVEEIQIISSEINGSTSCISSKIVVDETDLSLRRLEELHRQLHALQTEKSDRLKQIQAHLGALNSLCLVLGMDFKQTISEVHPSLDNYEGCKDISLDLIERLATAIKKLRDVKLQRMQRLQDLATTMLELWNLMDTPIEEQQMFQNITCNIAASEHEITEPDALSVDFINYVEAEVSRLEELKSSKMKELVLKKRTELEEICRKTHMVIEADSAIEYAIEAIESGVVDPSCVLDQIEVQVAKVKEEAFSRKDILERVDKWLFACDEECWLEEYNRDENRYNAGRGAHLTLKRAEKARALVNKLPAMVDALASKTIAWEKERGIEFTYDGVRLLSMLEEYTILRDEKEQERRRQRDQKKIQGQLIAEQEALYGSKPSPSKPSVKKGPRMSTGGASNRRLSMQAPKADPIHSARVPATPLSRPSSRKSDRGHQNDHHDDGLTALATGRRTLSRNSSFGSNYEPESPMRKPFAPISLPTDNGTFATPMKSTNVPEEDNTKTPKVMTFVPTTPQTVSVPMQTAVTPAPPPPQPIPYATKVVEEVTPEEIEYSFEEIRAGFVLPEAHTKSIHV
ncbi:putative microtubule-associated protein, MAP65/Ase1/PRC1 [Rosa chinensis]|uniref:Putative microtubule-associated protein, MAP65/Ase1/PRC1 n=1 Tax=Rosa chinensis TaxID=74649 RepID=A0A2P6SMG4_ROSCH|nr:65-kDa microtubule-associated protein 3 [Rosa chinensis]PRQ59888.1 putative microtubule-associated protein, MAP65/Ase1/PRC1 [Rosa chinensis]